MSPRSASYLIFTRRERHFCSPFAVVEEILEAPRLLDPGFAAPMLAAVILHEGRLLPVIDPALIVDQPAVREGMAILLSTPERQVVVLADTVLGFRNPVGVGPAPWVPAGRVCRQVAVVEPWGQVFVLDAEGLADVPAVPGPAAVAGVSSGGAAGGSRAVAGGAGYLTYTIAGRDYASAYADIQRILYRQPMYRIPGGGVPLRYAVDVNGAIVPVLELAFSGEAESVGPADDPLLASLVVLHSPHGPVALRVDAVGRPLALVPDRTDIGWFPSPGVAGIARHGEQPYSLVNGMTLVHDLLDAAGEKGQSEVGAA